MDAPPSYDTATSSSATANTTGSSSNPSKARNGIPPQSRRSMEDESRPLPPGWVRQFDPENHHQFFVDTTSNPSRSIWQHPYDDSTYMNSLSPEEREQINGLHRVPSEADVIAESSDEDEFHNHGSTGSHSKHAGAAGSQAQGREHFPDHLPRRSSPPPTGLHKFGRRMKDKITSTTHVERERTRQQRAEEEERIYQRHQVYRTAMAKAMETGEPQFIGKDKQGKDVFIEPPYGYGAPGSMGGGGMYPGQGGYGHGGIGYNPYQQGPYGPPNARYIRPAAPYSRPYGYGYGGGLGLPLGLGLGGGLLAGSLLF